LKAKIIGLKANILKARIGVHTPSFWVELSNPNQVLLTVEAGGRDGEDLAVLAGSRRREVCTASAATRG
jgi:hypothetical protein